MQRFTSHIVLLLLQALLCINVSAQNHDTLQSVKVLTKKGIDPAAQSTPVQSLNNEELQKLNSNSVADAVKHFAGVIVKDYGGIGGLKTVSVRSLGANHTGVMYDGLMLGDAQGGQIDLGKFSLDNTEEIRLYTGNIDLLSPARASSTSSLLLIKTTLGDFTRNEKLNIRAGIKAGSFGLIQPALSVSGLVGKRFQTGISCNYQSAKGEYPFVSYENKDSITRRKNSDIKTFRIEYDAAYKISDSNVIQLKAYHYESKRGIPGFAVLTNTEDGGVRFNDRNSFIQGSWKNYISRKSRLLISAKFSKDYNFYRDTAYRNIYHLLENEFHQQEAYVSAAYSYRITDHLSAGIAGDYFNSRLKRNDFLNAINADFATPNRNSFLENVILRYKTERLEVNANFLYTSVNEKVITGKKGRDLHKLNPGFSVSVQPFASSPIRIRAFYKNIFRVPTFNDLYYTNVGNPDLRPEYADEFNLGITYQKNRVGMVSKILFTVDAYYNKVKDKIQAYPARNSAQWSIQNIGRVDIHGADATLQLKLNEMKKLHFSADMSYSYQHASDISNPASASYKKQLFYTPKYSGSAGVTAAYQRASLSWNILFSSYRYRQGALNYDNLLENFNTNDLSFSYQFKEKNGSGLKLIAEANNIFNTQYEIIRYYPMPGFNYRIGLIANFKK